MAGFSVRALIFSFNSFAAAMLALWVSFSLGLERPFWAMATAYITSQPQSGAVRSKAVFRLSGTIVGASVTVLLVPALVDAPVLLSIALAGWVALCQFVSLLDRTPRSYAFMLAGYTAALIGFPSVMRPEAIFDTAVLRAEEIGVGVVAATLIHSVVFPSSVGGVLAGRVAAILAEARRWTANALAPGHPAATPAERRRLAADVSELHGLATHLPFDTARARPRRALLAALQDRLAMLLPLVSAVEDRRSGLLALEPEDDELATLLADVRGWVDGSGAEPASELAARAQALAERSAEPSWRGLLALNLAQRIGELVEAWQATALLAGAVTDPARADEPAVRALVGERARRPLHRDLAMALLSASATLVATLGCCAFWIVSGWAEGAIAAMIAAVICCFFATLDDPVPAQRNYLA